jgi:formylglycine-generating enzyme required for sulfatase activity
MTPQRIFICYRREDSAAVAGRLYDRLKTDFDDGVFMDIDNIPMGADFRQHIEEQLRACDYLLALIGPRWIGILHERADDQRDLLRVELETAASLKIRIAPILLEGARPPQATELPATFSLRKTLARLQSVPVRQGLDFDTDYQRIVKEIRTVRRQARPLRKLVRWTLLGVVMVTAGIGGWFEFARYTAMNTPQLPKMVEIPGGTFDMGSPLDEAGRDEDEGPVHAVLVPAFALSKTEVKFEEYDRFAHATGRPFPHDQGWGRDKRPVINVSWNDALAYTAWLSRVTGLRYRLPSEAEWEYAARAGSTTAYWWGNTVQRADEVMANCDGCDSQLESDQTAPVASFPANGFGRRDMHGNVWEWTQDCWHANYHGAPSDGRAWGELNDGECTKRVIRGGSWSNGPLYLRSANRGRNGVEERNSDVGFRLARTLP